MSQTFYNKHTCLCIIRRKLLHVLVNNYSKGITVTLFYLINKIRENEIKGREWGRRRQTLS